MSKADIELGFKLIDLETAKYETFKKDGKHYLANQVLHSRRGMEQMLAALMYQPVEDLAEIRTII